MIHTICVTVNVAGIGEVEAYGEYVPGSPAVTTGPPDNWVPADPSEFIFDKVLIDILEVEQVNKTSAEEWIELIHSAVIDHIEGT